MTLLFNLYLAAVTVFFAVFDFVSYPILLPLLVTVPALFHSFTVISYGLNKLSVLVSS